MVGILVKYLNASCIACVCSSKDHWHSSVNHTVHSLFSTWQTSTAIVTTLSAGILQRKLFNVYTEKKKDKNIVIAYAEIQGRKFFHQSSQIFFFFAGVCLEADSLFKVTTSRTWVFIVTLPLLFMAPFYRIILDPF